MGEVSLLWIQPPPPPMRIQALCRPLPAQSGFSSSLAVPSGPAPDLD